MEATSKCVVVSGKNEIKLQNFIIICFYFHPLRLEKANSSDTVIWDYLKIPPSYGGFTYKILPTLRNLHLNSSLGLVEGKITSNLNFYYTHETCRCKKTQDNAHEKRL